MARSIATGVARLALLSLVALGACRDAAPPTEPSGVRSVSIALDAQQIVIGAATRAVATLRDDQGRTITGVTPTWSSLTPAILTVSPDGNVRGLQAGTGQIRAASGSAFSDAIVIVRNPLAGNIRLARDTATIFVPSGSVQAIAAVTDEQGAPIVNPAVAWTSSAAQVATVSGTGLVTAVASGTAVITGAIDNLSATLTVRVRPAANPLAPAITLVEPATLRPGAVFTISGQRFGTTPGGNLVHVDGVLASVQSASPTQLTIALPPTGFACEPSRNAYLQIAANGVIGGGLVPLQIGARRELAVGQSLTVSTADEIRCNELVPATGRWVVSIYNAGRTPPGAAGVGSVPFAIRGLAAGVSAASTTAAHLTAAAEPPITTLLRQGSRRVSDLGAAHIETLERNIEQLRRARRADAAGLAASRGAVRAGDGPRSGAAAQLGAVGAITTVRVPNLDAGDICVANFPIGVRTVVTTAHAIIVEDTASVAGGRATLRGQMDEYLVRLGDEFERVMWPILAASFGNPLAMDATLGGPGKVVMVFSPRVNAMQRGNVTAFVASCDFFPTSSRPSSNQGAFFYAFVPTSLAAGYSDPETRDQWMRLIRGTVIHEVKHIVSFAERYSRNLPVEDVSWEEGSARVAEEMFARSIYGTLPRANTRYAPTLGCDIRYLTVTPGCSDRPMLMLRHFDGLYAYASAPEIYSPLGRTFGGDVAMYAGAWSFLRWAADHFPGLESQFFRDLTTGAGTGAANLEARTGRTWDEMLGEWSLALYLDDLAAFNPQNPRLRLPSWDLNDIWNGLCTDLGPCVDPLNPTQVYSRSPPFFPRARAFGNFLIGVGTLVTGGFTLLDLTGGPLPSQIVELKALTSNADPPAVLRLTISRVR